MQKRFKLATTALLAFAVSAQAETLQEVQDKIHDIVSKYKSIQFKSKGTSDTSMQGYSMKYSSDSTYEVMRKGDTTVSRIESRAQTVTNIAGQESKMDTKTLMIDDGKDIWSITESPEKSIMKMKRDASQTSVFDPKASWKVMAQTSDIKLMPDETVDGKACWVIAIEPKDAAAKAMGGKNLAYYDKKTGLSPKSVSIGPDGKKTGEFITTDIKIDGTISPDRFTYTPPAGATVQDMTKIGADGIASDKEAPKSAEKTGAGKD